ncbi:MAG: ATP-binding protein [Acetobacter sp.]|nr:ATP-binding protein [Acetobacter sp.]
MGLLDIKPHEVSRDLRGYSVLFYGTPKSGKTTIASRFPQSLILAFEKGYNAIPGIMAQPLNTWGEFKKTLTELKEPAVQEKFSTIVIDTADIAYSLCEKYICNREGVDNIQDLAYGKGYKMVATEFDESIRKILQLNYGLVLISHAQDKTFKDANGEEYNQIVPTLDNKARLICQRTCDIVGYSCTADTEDGRKTLLYMRESPRYMAGSRFKYTPDCIEFSYENLVAAIADAIDKQAQETGGAFITEERTQAVTQEVTYDFDALKSEFQEIVGTLMSANQSNASKITAVVDKYLGKGKKVNDCSPEQAEQIDLIVHDLKMLIN